MGVAKYTKKPINPKGKLRTSRKFVRIFDITL